MSIYLREALEATVKMELYPWSQIDVYVEVLHADGGICNTTFRDKTHRMY